MIVSFTSMQEYGVLREIEHLLADDMPRALLGTYAIQSRHMQSMERTSKG